MARDAYGRLVAYLASRSRDIAAAEDALGDAFRAALEHWPRTGLPERPEAWLLATARRRLIDRARHARVQADATVTLLQIVEEREDATVAFADKRLELLFVCAHPAIAAAARTPMMLQTVLGLDAAAIAAAFLVAPATMGQRLVRAKARIRDAGIRFAVPERAELPARLDAVLEAIYAAYGTGWEDVAGADPVRHGLAEEGIWLARLLAALLPEEPEARGLLALVLFCESRRPARRAPDGRFVPLSEQDPAMWSADLILDARQHLTTAGAAGRPGRFQLEAAVQAVHVARADTGRTDWAAIALLHEGLFALAPTLGLQVARAASCAEAFGPARAHALLDAMPEAQVAGYQPYWALRAHLLARLGERAAARAAYARAIALSDDPAVRAWLSEQMAPSAL